jgi:hypothetical protein
MRRFTFRFAVIALTFLIGVTAVTIWLNRPQKRFTDDIYFPVGVFGTLESEEMRLVKAYSSGLAAMQEPPLSSLAGEGTEAYRVFWGRSFHPPASVRVWRSQGSAYLSVKQLTGVGVRRDGEDIFPKSLAVDVTRPMTPTEWEHLREKLSKAEFWAMPAIIEANAGLDGAVWLLEGVKAERYHVVHRWSPNEEGYREACIHLLRISGLNIDEAKGELY